MTFRISQFVFAFSFLLLLGGCSDKEKSSGSDNPGDDASDSLAFFLPGIQEWAELKEGESSTQIMIKSDSLRLRWSGDTLQFLGTELFGNAKATLLYFDGASFVLLDTFDLEIPADQLAMSVDAPGAFRFQLFIQLIDGRTVSIQPDSGLSIVSDIHLGGNATLSSSSTNSVSSSAAEEIRFEIQEGIWGGDFRKADTLVSMVLQCNQDQSFLQTMTYNWSQPVAGCKKLEYKGTWRQDSWVLTLDRATIAEYSACIHDWIGPPQEMVEEPMAFPIEFLDEQALDLRIQWPEINDWVLLGQQGME